VHLYLSNTKSLMVTYLDNYKAREVTFDDPEIPSRLKYFSTMQYDNRVLLCGGMNTYVENPDDEAGNWEIFDQTWDRSFEFNIKWGRITNRAIMTQKRAKHCLCMIQDPKNTFNKLILAIGGITISYKRDPYLKKTR
jgi:hypothetical protein